MATYRTVTVCLSMCLVLQMAASAEPLISDPVTHEEAKGQLKLDMRTQAGQTAQFVYPCVWERDHLNSTGGICLYRIDDTGDTLDKARVEILDPSNQVIWTKDVTATGWNWANSTFRTQTNVGNSTDASDKANRDSKEQYKFIDPGNTGSRTYTAKLTLEFKDGTTKTCSLNFSAKKRAIYLTNPVSGFECLGKCWAWKELGLTEDQAPAETTDPALHAPGLLFALAGKSFDTAYECVTPRGRMDFVSHGSAGGAEIQIVGTDYAGFKGPSSNAGTGLHGTIYDLAGHALSHNTNVDLIACWTADQGLGDRSVIQSFSESLKETVGGAGVVKGYSGIVSLQGFYPMTAGTINTPGMPEADRTLLVQAIAGIIMAQAQQAGKVGDSMPTPAWIGNTTVDKIKWTGDKDAYQTAIRQWVTQNIQGYDASQITVTTSFTMSIDVSQTTKTGTVTALTVPAIP